MNPLKQIYIIPYILEPNPNGPAERLNQTLLASIRSMLTHANLSHSLWAEALLTATYIKNRSPSAAIKINKTPFEVLNNHPPSVSHLKVFGEIGYAVNNKPSRKKLHAKAHPLIFVGYSNNSPGYRLFDPIKQTLIIARDVSFPSSPIFYKQSTSAEAPLEIQHYFTVSSPTDTPTSEPSNPVVEVSESLGTLSDTTDIFLPIPDYRQITTANILPSRLRSTAHLTISQPNITLRYTAY
jgi:hypothetical protein